MWLLAFVCIGTKLIRDNIILLHSLKKNAFYLCLYVAWLDLSLRCTHFYLARLCFVTFMFMSELTRKSQLPLLPYCLQFLLEVMLMNLTKSQLGIKLEINKL